jgi:outer membrane protein OmpA-like peptidoglycan-associated protein
VTITGYADEVGDSTYNQRLSLARAQAVAREFSGYTTRIEGAGENNTPYPGLTPEQRYYSRSVKITVHKNKDEAVRSQTP